MQHQDIIRSTALYRVAHRFLCAGLLSVLALTPAFRSDASVIYSLVSTSANTVSDWTWLTPDSNPNQIYMVFSNSNPGGSSATATIHPIGVWFSSYAQNWAVFNEDGSSMPLGAGFTVWTRPAQDNVYTHVATSANTNGAWTYIDNIYTNDNPYAMIWVTPNWNPGGSWFGVYNNHNVAVAYDPVRCQWAIVNQDSAAIPIGAAFNVIIEVGEYYPHYYVMRAAPLNNNVLAVPAVYLPNPSINGQPKAHIAVTPNFNPNGESLSYGVVDNHPLTVKYDTHIQTWYIANADGTLIPTGAAFNVWLLNQG